MHDHVRDILYDVVWQVGIQVKKEAPVNFLTDPTDGRSTLHPANVLIYNWSEGKQTCVHITRASPMVDIGNGIFEVGQAAIYAAVAPEAVKLLKRFQRIMDNNMMTVGGNVYIFRRVGFAIQKELAA
ncbi:hypothetical protein FRX31_033457 [Thalictrum thalictroides]|uniref:Uncharacterized protein n=1 Tax=Thalictrum thalictroides TaxID=46969 RepID=A0A7J6UWH8_THATH|nr:hypothetical protein FRX31_033457 [Thalictrum thalictroides]